MSDPSVMEAMRNPRVSEAFRQIQEGFSTLRREAPQLLKYLKIPFSQKLFKIILAFSKLEQWEVEHSVLMPMHLLLGSLIVFIADSFFSFQSKLCKRTCRFIQFNEYGRRKSEYIEYLISYVTSYGSRGDYFQVRPSRIV